MTCLQVDFFADETKNGIVGSPYCIAFDWVGRNLYIGNVEASEISMVRVDGKLKYRMLVLANTGEETGEQCAHRILGFEKTFVFSLNYCV